MKTPDRKHKQVLPNISVNVIISVLYIHAYILFLFLHAVYEKLEDGMRMGYKDYDKGFLLPNKSIENAIPINPIKIQLNEDNVKNGIFMELF